MINKFDGPYAFLSNFYHSPIVYEGLEYPTVEHAFQAAKTLKVSERESIAALPTPGAAKRAGRQVALRKDWEEVKIDVMRECLKEKFKDPVLFASLVATGDEELIEGNYWHDNFWGVCSCERSNGQGLNQLGKLLMELRAELRLRALDQLFPEI
jgi:ribA/ribD-fused uncharacterized protein